MKTAIIILNYNDKKNTKRLTKTLEKYKAINKIIVVDNCSPKNDYEDLKKLKSKKTDVVLSDKNGGYSYGNNVGLKYLEENYGLYDYIIISNPDIEIEEDAIEYTIDFLENNPKVGLASPRVEDLNGNKYLLSGWRFREIWEDTVLQSNMMIKRHIHGDIKRLYQEERDQEICYSDCISGCFFIIRGKLFKEIDYFDEKLFIYGEEDIIGHKVHKLGYTAAVLNAKKVVHYESVAISQSFKRRKQLKHLHRSLRHYYKTYDEKVGLIDLLKFDFFYYFGAFESYLGEQAHKNKYFRKCLNLAKRTASKSKRIVKKTYFKIRKVKTRHKFYNSDILTNGKPTVLYLVHKWNDDIYSNQNIGGSLYTAIDILKNSLKDYNFIVMSPNGENYHFALYSEDRVITLEDCYFSPDFSVSSPSYEAFLNNFIKKTNITIIHIHSLIGHYPSISNLAKENNCKLIVTLHDFYLYCLNYLLLNKNGEFCKLDTKNCKKCIKGKYKYEDLKKWREEIKDLLQQASAIIAPSTYVKEKFEEFYGDLDIKIIEHKVDGEKNKLSKKEDLNPLKVAFLGGISQIKGSHILKELIKLNNQEKNNIEFHLFGISDIEELNKNAKNYICHGEYKREDLLKLLKDNDIDMAAILSIIPETYSYTLSEAVLAGLPVLGIELGAIGNRIKDNNIGWLKKENTSPKEILNELKEIKKNPKEYHKVRENVEKYQNKIINTKSMAKCYQELYRS